MILSGNLAASNDHLFPSTYASVNFSSEGESRSGVDENAAVVFERTFFSPSSLDTTKGNPKE